MGFEGNYVSLKHDYSHLVEKALYVQLCTYSTYAISCCVGSFALFRWWCNLT